MAAEITTLRTRQDRLRLEQAAALRQMVLADPNLPARAVSEIIASIDRETISNNSWIFVMISPSQHASVVNWLLDNSSQPMKAVKLWAQCLCTLRMDTGQIVSSRDELADAVGIPADEVSRIMGELERVGAISKRRERVTGMRGRGCVAYYVNPRVATHLPGAARVAAQAAAPNLTLV